MHGYYTRDELPVLAEGVNSDLAAITRLDEVRTADLAELRSSLNPPAASAAAGPG